MKNEYKGLTARLFLKHAVECIKTGKPVPKQYASFVVEILGKASKDERYVGRVKAVKPADNHFRSAVFDFVEGRKAQGATTTDAIYDAAELPSFVCAHFGITRGELKKSPRDIPYKTIEDWLTKERKERLDREHQAKIDGDEPSYG